MVQRCQVESAALAPGSGRRVNWSLQEWGSRSAPRGHHHRAQQSHGAAQLPWSGLEVAMERTCAPAGGAGGEEEMRALGAEIEEELQQLRVKLDLDEVDYEVRK